MITDVDKEFLIASEPGTFFDFKRRVTSHRSPLLFLICLCLFCNWSKQVSCMFVGGVLALDYAAPAKLLPSVFHEHWQLRLRGASVAGHALSMAQDRQKLLRRMHVLKASLGSLDGTQWHTQTLKQQESDETFCIQPLSPVCLWLDKPLEICTGQSSLCYS